MEKYGFCDKNIHLLTNMNASYDNILTAINDVKGKVASSDEVIFFFSGHGQFTHYFIDEGMLKGYAEKPDDTPGILDVTVEEAFDYASANCTMQKPVIRIKNILTAKIFSINNYLLLYIFLSFF
jgi:hypothetical protein